MSDWATSDRRLLVAFAPTVVTGITRYLQLTDTAPEAGGLLLGTVHGQHMSVCGATTPTKMDRRSRYSFERLPSEHRSIAYKNWHTSGGLVRYLGEWHTHPEDHPTPSGTDLTEWKKLAARRADGRQLLVSIAGRKSLYVALVSRAGLLTRLEPIR